MSGMRHDRDKMLMAVLKEFGSASELASFLELSPQTISGWKKIPVQYIRAISAKTGIDAHDIRPDYYVETYWSLGKNTNEIAFLMRLSESEVYKLLVRMLEQKRSKSDDTDCSPLSPQC